MDHLERVRQEFTRQADTFATWATAGKAELTARFIAAMAPVAGGRLLDVACGPGVLTAALAAEAQEVVGFDLTAEMLKRARARCTAAGLTNVRFEEGDATELPFEAQNFDGAVTRLSVHHLVQPEPMIREIFRILKPGALFVLGDIVSSENREESDLHNALEVLRDPSHTRMLPTSELLALIERAGFVITHRDAWDQPRRFEEWMKIANDPTRRAPLKTVLRGFVAAGKTAGITLARDGDEITFIHHWQLVQARKPSGD